MSGIAASSAPQHEASLRQRVESLRQQENGHAA
jgi:hypothetical protein